MSYNVTQSHDQNRVEKETLGYFLNCIITFIQLCIIYLKMLACFQVQVMFLLFLFPKVVENLTEITFPKQRWHGF